MGFFKRLFSSDYRAAVAAEAAGDYELAAERYALAGHPEAAVRVHLARASRADKRSDEIAALRDAVHWAHEDDPARPQVARKLGKALLARAEAEGIATERDRERVREAAGHLIEAGEYLTAGDALEKIGDHKEAVAAFRSGGLVNRMEQALGADERTQNRERERRQSYLDYELNYQGGSRDAAMEALRRVVEVAETKTEYRRLLDDLESRLISSGRAVLRVRGGQEISLCTGPNVLLGRDPLCDLVLRSGGISRRHAEIRVVKDGSFFLRDAGSRNGTTISEMPISGEVALTESGEFAMGPDCHVHYRVQSEVLILSIKEGVDAGKVLRIAAEGDIIDLDAPPITVRFRSGRPILARDRAGMRVSLNGERLAAGEIQLIHGDQLIVDGIDFEVA